MTGARESRSLIFLTIMAAILLAMLPLPELIAPFKPYWLALVVIYWVLETRAIISLGRVFLIWLVLDHLVVHLRGVACLSPVASVKAAMTAKCGGSSETKLAACACVIHRTLFLGSG